VSALLGGERAALSDRPGTYRDAVRNREFRGLVIAQVTSEWGDHIARVALASLVLRRTDSALLAVLAFVVSFVPAVFGSAILGSFADRLPRKVILLGCDLARFVVMLLLAALAVSSTPIWVLLGLLLVAETFYAPFEVAQRSVIPDVLTDPKDYLAGNSLMRMLYQLDQVIGICLAGLVIHAVGERWGLLLNATTFAISFVVIALMLRWRPATREAAERANSLLTDLRAGWRLVFEDPALRALVLLGWGASVFLIAPEAVGLAYAREDGAPSAVGAALMASVPAGAAIGAFIVGRLGPLQQVRSIVPLAVLTCLPLLATCFSPPWEVALVLWFASGLGQGFMVPLMATVSLVSPAKFRGRVIGLAAAGFSATTAATFLLSGLVADLTSPAVAVTFAAVVGLALVGAAHRTWPHGAIQRAANRVYASAPPISRGA
jgi:MFS family permease